GKGGCDPSRQYDRSTDEALPDFADMRLRALERSGVVNRDVGNLSFLLEGYLCRLTQGELLFAPPSGHCPRQALLAWGIYKYNLVAELVPTRLHHYRGVQDRRRPAFGTKRF